MTDDREVFISSKEFQKASQTQDGKGLHFVTDVNAELPVKLTQSGPGSERPITLCQQFFDQCKTSASRPALHVERDGKQLMWTWQQYYLEAMTFAKALASLKVKERSAVAIMGFNSPEWVFGFVGGILYNCVSTGIYITNAPEACHYQTEHSEAEIVLVETNDMLKRFDQKKLPLVKAFVIWGEKELPAGSDSKVYLWKDFMKLGKDVKDQVIIEKALKQKAGHCCTLIYTSGTTGMPKGCMLCHDNLTWPNHETLKALRKAEEPLPDNEHRVVSYLPLSHIAGLMVDCVLMIYSGHQLYFARPDALAGTLVQTLQWAKPTIFFAVPRVWEKFEEKLKEIASTKPAFMQSISGWAKGHGAEAVKQAQKGQAYSSVSFSIANSLILTTIKKAIGLDKCLVFCFGAAPLKKTSVEYFASLTIPLFNLYGMSETAGGTTMMTRQNFRLDTAGFGVPGTDLKINNPDENGEGEICMRGRNSMMGYLKNEQATIDTIDNQGFIHSGDKGKLEKDGHLKITGRIKELIIGAGGENIAPVPVEDNFKAICTACSNIMIVGEQQRFMAALITFKVDIDPKSGQPSLNLMPEAVKLLKQECGVDVKTSEEACKNQKVIDFIQKCVELTNKKSISRAAHIRKFRLISTDFSIPGGELTPTLKLKRKVTEKKFQSLVDEMFAPEAKL